MRTEPSFFLFPIKPHPLKVLNFLKYSWSRAFLMHLRLSFWKASVCLFPPTNFFSLSSHGVSQSYCTFSFCFVLLFCFVLFCFVSSRSTTTPVNKWLGGRPTSVIHNPPPPTPTPPMFWSSLECDCFHQKLLQLNQQLINGMQEHKFRARIYFEFYD